MDNKVFGTGLRARCTWEVRGGVLPGTPMPEHTKRFTVTSDTYYEDLELKDEEFKAKYPDGNGVFRQAQKEAYDYALSLQDPDTLTGSRYSGFTTKSEGECQLRLCLL